MGLDIIWNIHCKSLKKKGTDQLTNARGMFGLWKMAEKIALTAEGGSMEATTTSAMSS